MGLFGTPEITPFRGGCIAAVSLEFDDSMISQVENALPVLAQYKMAATFFINPGVGHYQKYRSVWENDVARAGHELGNHTFTHKGAANAAEAEDEIKKCSEVLARIDKNRPRLTPFATPGGVKWQLTPEEEARILTRYRLFPTPNRIFLMDDGALHDPHAIPEIALKNRSWVHFGMHGIGGEWLSTSVSHLKEALDFLVAHRDEIWTAPTGAVYRYTAERAAAKPVVLSHISERGFSAMVECDLTKINTYGLPLPTLYDQPLTVRVPVPASWRSIKIIPGASLPAIQNPTLKTADQTFAQFELLPQTGAVRIEKV